MTSSSFMNKPVFFAHNHLQLLLLVYIYFKKITTKKRNQLPNSNQRYNKIATRKVSYARMRVVTRKLIRTQLNISTKLNPHSTILSSQAK